MTAEAGVGAGDVAGLGEAGVGAGAALDVGGSGNMDRRRGVAAGWASGRKGEPDCRDVNGAGDCGAIGGAGVGGATRVSVADAGDSEVGALLSCSLVRGGASPASCVLASASGGLLPASGAVVSLELGRSGGGSGASVWLRAVCCASSEPERCGSREEGAGSNKSSGESVASGCSLVVSGTIVGVMAALNSADLR